MAQRRAAPTRLPTPEERSVQEPPCTLQETPIPHGGHPDPCCLASQTPLLPAESHEPSTQHLSSHP